MTQQLTCDLAPAALGVAMRAHQHASRLRHGYLGAEHFLLALCGAGQSAGAVLREHGLTPDRVETELARRAGAGLFGDLDRDALAATGVDVDTVRATAEASFGQAALGRANQDARRRGRVGADPGSEHMPHSPGGVQAIVNAAAEADAGHSPQVGIQHLALGVLAVRRELVPVIVTSLGASGLALRAAILDRYSGVS
jgi:hypothetical protein